MEAQQPMSNVDLALTDIVQNTLLNDAPNAWQNLIQRVPDKIHLNRTDTPSGERTLPSFSFGSLF